MFNFLREIFDDPQPRRARKSRTPRQRPSGYHTFTVQKPFCAPCRDFVYTALEPYGIPVFNYSEKATGLSIKDAAKLWKIELRTFENLKYGPGAATFLPFAQQATFSVPKAQASWAEYLIESTGRLCVTGGRIDAKNRKWGDRRLGKMPTPWDKRAGVQYAQSRIQPPENGKPWIESSCSAGKKLWQEVNIRVKKARSK